MNEQVIKKISIRIIPFIMLLFFISILDRTNISIASLTMNKDLEFSNLAFGLGAGIFFIGYALFEVPSNLILDKVGARKWIARILITWGIISVAMMFVTGIKSFYILRFLLGVAEAGFYPGMIYYLTRWFPYESRIKAFGFFQIASPIAVLIGSPVSGLLLGLNGMSGLKGWQWLFLLEGIPAIILGFITLFYLTDSPEKAKWLKNDEKVWLIDKLKLENDKKELGHLKFKELFRNLTFLKLNFIYFCIVTSLYGVSFWLPQIIKKISVGSSNLNISLLSAIPSLAAIIAIVLISRHSDKTGERRLHSAIPALIGAAALLLSAYMNAPFLALVALAVASAGIQSAIPTFWSFPSKMFSGVAAAGAIAMINSVGNLGGFVGPYTVGYISSMTGNLQSGLVFLAVMLFLGCMVTLGINKGGKENIVQYTEKTNNI
jgi:ACS family tartrate transporter-like MFS transporter